MTIDSLYLQIVSKIQKFESNNKFWGKNYLGTDKIILGNTAKDRDRIVSWLLTDYSELITPKLLDSLYRGEFYFEKSIAGQLLKKSTNLRSQITFCQFYIWLGLLNGWAEIDSSCQSTFTFKDLFSDWILWSNFFRKLNKDDNVSRRRASLVLLTGPVSHISDKRLSDLSFVNIESLKNEKDILITKAISWLLRSLVKYHRNELNKYIEQNKKSIPSIAYRETRRKLDTGKK